MGRDFLPVSAPPGSFTASRTGGGMRRFLVVVAGVFAAGCATSIESSPTIADPMSVALTARPGSGPSAPARIQFGWTYAEDRGTVHGDGVGRYNAPDSLRLDLFTSGDVAMAVSLTPVGLVVSGQIEDVALPPTAFLYAMAGIFIPGDEAPIGAWAVDGDSVVAYAASAGGTRYFYLRDGRLRRLEEKRGGRTLRRVNLEWSDREWPDNAEYRDYEERNRARWVLGEIRQVDQPFPTEIYELHGSR